MPGKFMHVLCARWNRDVDHKVEPYAVNRREIGKHVNMSTLYTFDDVCSSLSSSFTDVLYLQQQRHLHPMRASRLRQVSDGSFDESIGVTHVL